MESRSVDLSVYVGAGTLVDLDVHDDGSWVGVVGDSNDKKLLFDGKAFTALQP
jgi:hypothetical protein